MIIDVMTSWILKHNSFSNPDTQELSMLDLVGKTAYKMNEVVTELNTKMSNTGDFLGTWHGFTPVQSEPGIQAVVNSNTNRITGHDELFVSKQQTLDALLLAKQNAQNQLFADNTIVLNGLGGEILDLQNKRTYISVAEFGAVGDGVTDDTASIQACINASGERFDCIFFPPTLNYYNVSTLNIPDGHHELTLMGADRFASSIHFSSTICFTVGSEMLNVKNIGLVGAGMTVVGSIMFKDTRPNNRADFDIFLNEMYAYSVETVVQTRGRGVTIDNCNFYQIRYQIIKADYPDEVGFQEGTEDTQTYSSGFRGFIIRNSRIHYCTCWLISNTGSNSMNLSGVLITGNQLEGSVGYFEGYLRNAIIKDNMHIHSGNVRTAGFMLTGCKNVDMDLNISGKRTTWEGNDQFINKIVDCTGGFMNLTIRGSITDVYYECFTFHQGGSNLVIDVNVNNMSAIGVGYGMLKLDGAYVYDGITVRGSINSPNAGFISCKGNSNVVQNYNVQLEIKGAFTGYDNFDGTADGATRKTLKGVYAGDGLATQTILLPYYATTVQVYSATYSAMSSSLSSSLATTIAVGSTGFLVNGLANTSGTIYGYIVN